MSTITDKFTIHHINGALGPFNVNVNVKSTSNADEIIKLEITSTENDLILNVESLNDFVSLIALLREVDSALVNIIRDY